MHNDDDSDTHDESTQRSVSEGVSTRSGYSDEIGAAGLNQPVRPAQRNADFALNSAASPKCTMCDSSRSEFQCPQCGRLSFCLKCCVSLHDNKFLGSHKLISLDVVNEGLEFTVLALKELQQSKQASHATAKKAEKSLPSSGEAAAGSHNKSSTASHHQPHYSKIVDDSLDIAALAADRNVIHARLRELSSCREWLDRIYSDLNLERLGCKETTHTATEAVRRKFDVLRQVINTKEAEYIAVVETAGRKRLDLATQVCCSSSLSLSEVEAFVTQMSNQLSRLEINHQLFNDARKSMLDETQRRLHGVDDVIHTLQSSLDDIRSVSLGVHIPMDDAIDTVRSMAPPLALSSRLHDVPHIQPMSSEKFLSAPGITVVRQATEIPRSDAARSVNGGEATAAERANFAAMGLEDGSRISSRKTFAQELASLKATPLDAVRGTNSPMRQSQPPAQSEASSQRIAAAPPQGGSASTMNIMARIAAKAQQQNHTHSSAGSFAATLRTSSPLGQRSSVVPELERLRQQISATTSIVVGRNNNTSVSSPMSRGRSPTARPSPQRRVASPQHNAAPQPVLSLMPLLRQSSDVTPGPGAYHKPHDFAQRSILSTPPRRRVN